MIWVGVYSVFLQQHETHQYWLDLPSDLKEVILAIHQTFLPIVKPKRTINQHREREIHMDNPVFNYINYDEEKKDDYTYRRRWRASGFVAVAEVRNYGFHFRQILHVFGNRWAAWAGVDGIYGSSFPPHPHEQVQNKVCHSHFLTGNTKTGICHRL